MHKGALERHSGWFWRSLILVLVFMDNAIADPPDQTLTQTGATNSICDQNGYSAPFDVTFPKKFGGIPTVKAQWKTMKGPHVHLHDVPLIKVTRTGFRAQMPLLSYRPDFPFPIKVGWVATGPELQSGTVFPDYMVLTVIYAPPGTNGGHSTSSVSYQSGSTTGTLTSSSKSFKNGVGVSVDLSGGIFGNGGGVGVAFDATNSSTDSDSLEIKKSSTATITQAGPAQDGINHDEDEIWLLLKPTIDLEISSTNVDWMLANTDAKVQYVHVGWLNGHQPMPPGVASALENAGITQQAYPELLAHDPLVKDESALNSSRFVSIHTTFPYEPPYAAADPVPTSSYVISNSQVTTAGTTAEDSFRVQAYAMGSVSYMTLVTAKIKNTASWEWTNRSSTTASTGSSQTATLSVGGPSYGYAGPSVVGVYYDTIYRTFAFTLLPVDVANPAVRGTVLMLRGTPATNSKVTLLDHGKKESTYTNSRGEFNFFGDLRGPITIQASGVNRVIHQVEPAQKVTIQVTSGAASKSYQRCPCRRHVLRH